MNTFYAVQLFLYLDSEVYLEISQTFTVELFPKIVNDLKLVTIFAKNSFLYVRVSSEFAFDIFLANRYLLWWQ